MSIRQYENKILPNLEETCLDIWLNRHNRAASTMQLNDRKVYSALIGSISIYINVLNWFAKI